MPMYSQRRGRSHWQHHQPCHGDLQGNRQHRPNPSGSPDHSCRGQYRFRDSALADGDAPVHRQHGAHRNAFTSSGNVITTAALIPRYAASEVGPGTVYDITGTTSTLLIPFAQTVTSLNYNTGFAVANTTKDRAKTLPASLLLWLRAEHKVLLLSASSGGRHGSSGQLLLYDNCRITGDRS